MSNQNNLLDKNSSVEERKRRRTRNDDEGRNFTCHCGKSYLSYPALYTHVKTKHGGKSELTAKGHLKEDHSADSEKDDDAYDEAEKQDQPNHIEVLKKFLLKFFPFAQKDQEKKLKQISKDDQNYLKSIREYWDKKKKQDEIHENETYSTPIDFVLGKFLIEMDGEMTKSCQRFLNDFVLQLRNGINEIKQNPDYCATTNASTVLHLYNEIFLQKFQKLGDEYYYLKHPTVLVKTMFHLARWLFQERFTNLSVKFNTL